MTERWRDFWGGNPDSEDLITSETDHARNDSDSVPALRPPVSEALPELTWATALLNFAKDKKKVLIAAGAVFIAICVASIGIGLYIWGHLEKVKLPDKFEFPPADVNCTDASMDCYTDTTARKLIYKFGIRVHSVGHCTSKKQANCTSFQQIHQSVIVKIILLQNRSQCHFVITGGTEQRKNKSLDIPDSHVNGWRLNVRKWGDPAICLLLYVGNKFEKLPGEHEVWCSKGGVKYSLKDSAWDVDFWPENNCHNNN